MGMIYRRKKRDPTTSNLVEVGPYWMKYYIDGRPIQESTRTFDRTEAKRLLKEKEGAVASGLYRGPKIERLRFEDLAALVQQDYQINKRKTLRRVNEYMNHLEKFFRKLRARDITTERSVKSREPRTAPLIGSWAALNECSASDSNRHRNS